MPLNSKRPSHRTPDNPEQFERFLKTAREPGADTGDAANFDRVLEKVAQSDLPKPAPKTPRPRKPKDRTWRHRPVGRQPATAKSFYVKCNVAHPYAELSAGARHRRPDIAGNRVYEQRTGADHRGPDRPVGQYLADK